MTKSAPVETTHTLESLGASLGPASEDELLAQVGPRHKADFIAEGARVATPRISKDAARIYGDAFDFLQRASAEQLDHLPTFSRDSLRVAVWSAAEGHRRYQQLLGNEAHEATRQSSSHATVDSLAAHVEAKREILHSSLLSLAAGDTARIAEVNAAFGTVEDLGGAVIAMTALLRTWRSDGSKALKDRIKASRLQDAWLAGAEKLAHEFTKNQQAAAATRSKGAVPQSAVDEMDGMNLAFLKSIVAQFESAHMADATIPRLTFNALQSHVHRIHHKAAPSEPTSTSK